MKQSNFIVVAIFPLRHTLEMKREDGKIFYWKLHATHNIRRYSVGMTVTPYLIGVPNATE